MSLSSGLESWKGKGCRCPRGNLAWANRDNGGNGGLFSCEMMTEMKEFRNNRKWKKINPKADETRLFCSALLL